MGWQAGLASPGPKLGLVKVAGNDNDNDKDKGSDSFPNRPPIIGPRFLGARTSAGLAMEPVGKSWGEPSAEREEAHHQW